MNGVLYGSNDQTIKSILKKEIIVREAVLKIKNDKFLINKLFNLIREDNFNEFKRNFKNLMNEDQTQRAYEILKVHQENNLRNIIIMSNQLMDFLVRLKLLKRILNLLVVSLMGNMVVCKYVNICMGS